jgi:hypothetical protein
MRFLRVGVRFALYAVLFVLLFADAFGRSAEAAPRTAFASQRAHGRPHHRRARRKRASSKHKSSKHRKKSSKKKSSMEY